MLDMMGTFDRYVINGIKTGSFTKAMIEGDIEWAKVKADSVNIHRINLINNFIEEVLPHNSRGSAENYQSWKGLMTMYGDVETTKHPINKYKRKRNAFLTKMEMETK